MSQYYFLVASLPLLTYDDEAELSSEQFLEIIKTNLHPADSATVAAASIEAPRTVDGASVSERMWRTYDRGLRNVLARSRAPQRNTDANHYIRTDELLHDETQRAGLEELAREATLAPSPLSAEDLLNRARWRELENLEVGHNFDVQLRYRAGRVPLRLRFRQNRATRDLAFRWQPEVSVASQLYLLSHVDVEAAYPVQGGEWLASYQLRHEDQRKTIPGLFTTEQKWFNRRHDMSLSRLWNGRFARWLRGGVIYRQSEEVTGLPTAWAVDLEGGVRLTSDRMDFTLTGGWRSLEDDEPWWRLGSALAWTASRSDRILVSAGGTRRGASELVRYLPASPSAGAYIETGDRALQHSEDVTVSVSWRHRGRAFDWDAIASGGRSDGAPAWLASGDTAILNATYQPYNLTREFAGAALNIKWRTFRWLGIGGSYDRLLINEWDGGDGPAFSPNETWHGYLQFTLRFLDDKFHVMPVVSTRGARGGTLPDVWATVSAGVDARLKQLTVFWHRENLTDQEYRTGGWAPAYGLHSRFGFSWDFWK